MVVTEKTAWTSSGLDLIDEDTEVEVTGELLHIVG